MDKIVKFTKEKVTKLEYEDAECSQCGKGFYFSKDDNLADCCQFRGYAYTYWGRHSFGLQMCQECFDKLEDRGIKNE